MKTVTNVMIILVVFSTSLAFAQERTANDPENSATLKTYLIEREMPGAGALTQKELQGASQKSCEVLNEMGSDIVWLNSYVLDDKIYCVYKAQSKELIKEHAEKSGFPCNKIMEIKENIDPSTAIPKSN